MSKRHMQFADVMYKIVRVCIVVGIAAAVTGYYIDVSQRDTIVIQGIPELPVETHTAELLYPEPDAGQTSQQESSAMQEMSVYSVDAGQSGAYVQPDGVQPAEQDVNDSVTEPDEFPAAVGVISETEGVNIAGLQADTDAHYTEASGAVENGGLININTAPANKLTELDGIGEAKARAIVEYREEHGGFKTVDELVKVSGIGEKTLEKNRDKIIV